LFLDGHELKFQNSAVLLGGIPALAQPGKIKRGHS
jgi:hypothetical protein